MKFIFPGWLYLKIIQDDAKVLNPRSGSKSHNVDKVWSNWWCLIYGKYLSQVVLPTSSLLVFFCVDDVILRAILGVSWPPFCSRISMLALYWAIYIFSSLDHTFPVHLFYLLYIPKSLVLTWKVVCSQNVFLIRDQKTIFRSLPFHIQTQFWEQIAITLVATTANFFHTATEWPNA